MKSEILILSIAVRITKINNEQTHKIMKIKSFAIQNFKSIKSLEIFLDKNLSVLTGINNSGKTTILEAIALWVECVNILTRRAKRSVANKYQKGDRIIDGAVHYFQPNQLTSICCPSLRDIFNNCDEQKNIILSAILKDDESSSELRIAFVIRSSTQSRYAVQLYDENNFDYTLFHKLFINNQEPIISYYSTPLANIVKSEEFMTLPVIQDHLSKRESYAVLRNRLYKLYYTSMFANFQQDLSYILYGLETKVNLTITPRSDIQKHKNVVLKYTIGEDVIEKDLALLGSGTIQVLEILVNVYSMVDAKKDMHLILLDEPDSHIHRDIQRRLFEVLNRKTDNNQIVLTTHNESFIRNTPLSNLFHIDGRGEGKIMCMKRTDLPSIQDSRFCGIYPDTLTPVISKLCGNKMGLDFVSAIEADLIVFVEGEDDARLLFKLFNNNVLNKNKKIVFWVLGGVSKILKLLPAYQTLFSEIHNKKTLWQKSCLVFDRDRMTDMVYEKMALALSNKMMLSHYAAPIYTQESVLLTDLQITSRLLVRAFKLDNSLEIPLSQALQDATTSYHSDIYTQMNEPSPDVVNQYLGMYINPINSLLPQKEQLTNNGVAWYPLLKSFAQDSPLNKLVDKHDVANIINQAFEKVGISDRYDAENDFYRLVVCSDTSTQFEVWKDITEYLTKMSNRK